MCGVKEALHVNRASGRAPDSPQAGGKQNKGRVRSGRNCMGALWPRSCGGGGCRGGGGGLIGWAHEQHVLTLRAAVCWWASVLVGLVGLLLGVCSGGYWTRNGTPAVPICLRPGDLLLPITRPPIGSPPARMSPSRATSAAPHSTLHIRPCRDPCPGQPCSEHTLICFPTTTCHPKCYRARRKGFLGGTVQPVDGSGGRHRTGVKATWPGRLPTHVYNAAWMIARRGCAYNASRQRASHTLLSVPQHSLFTLVLFFENRPKRRTSTGQFKQYTRRNNIRMNGFKRRHLSLSLTRSLILFSSIVRAQTPPVGVQQGPLSGAAG